MLQATLPLLERLNHSSEWHSNIQSRFRRQKSSNQYEWQL